MRIGQEELVLFAGPCLYLNSFQLDVKTEIMVMSLPTSHPTPTPKNLIIYTGEKNYANLLFCTSQHFKPFLWQQNHSNQP